MGCVTYQLKKCIAFDSQGQIYFYVILIWILGRLGESSD